MWLVPRLRMTVGKGLRVWLGMKLGPAVGLRLWLGMLLGTCSCPRQPLGVQLRNNVGQRL